MIAFRQVFSHQAHRLAMQMGPRLRAGDAAECAAAGMTGYEAVASSLRDSAFAFGAFDGAFEGAPPLGLWGAVPRTVLGDCARLWFLTAEGAEQHKRAFLRDAREFVAFAEAQYPRLEALVHKDYAPCVRWLRRLGFTIGDPLPGYFGGGFCIARIGF